MCPYHEERIIHVGPLSCLKKKIQLSAIIDGIRKISESMHNMIIVYWPLDRSSKCKIDSYDI